MKRACATALLLLMAAGCDDGAVLVVDLKTDFTPGIEFVTVRTEVLHEGGGSATDESAAVFEADFVSGRRVAEIDGIEVGSVTVRMFLLDQTGGTLVERSVAIDMSGDYGLTVVMARSCLTVTCPSASSPASASSCWGGRCADPGCSVETPELCPAPECTADADCTPGAACAVGRCADGVCLSEGRHEMCAADEFCDGAVGCRARPGACPESPCRFRPPQCGCGAGDACYLDDTMQPACFPVGTARAGEYCFEWYDCEPGLACGGVGGAGGVCAPFCDGSAECPAACISLDIVGTCSPVCDPIANTGCPTPLGCAAAVPSGWPDTTVRNPTLLCVPVGPTHGQPCSGALCGPGTICDGGTCVDLCTFPGGTCPAGTRCLRATMAGFVVQGTEYGVCN